MDDKRQEVRLITKAPKQKKSIVELRTDEMFKGTTMGRSLDISPRVIRRCIIGEEMEAMLVV